MKITIENNGKISIEELAQLPDGNPGEKSAEETAKEMLEMQLKLEWFARTLLKRIGAEIREGSLACFVALYVKQLYGSPACIGTLPELRVVIKEGGSDGL